MPESTDRTIITKSTQYTTSKYSVRIHSYLSTIQANTTHRTNPQAVPTVQYCTVSIGVPTIQYYTKKQAKIDRKIEAIQVILSHRPQVLKPLFRPYSLQDQDPRVNCAFD